MISELMHHTTLLCRGVSHRGTKPTLPEAACGRKADRERGGDVRGSTHRCVDVWMWRKDIEDQGLKVSLYKAKEIGGDL